MNVSLLFRKRSPLVEDGLPFITGNETHGYIAKRNSTGEANASAILVRALKCAVSGEISSCGFNSSNFASLSNSKSSPGSTPGALLDLSTGTIEIPNGEPEKMTYYFGLPFIVEAFYSGTDGLDLLMAYYDLLKQVTLHGWTEAIKPAMLHAADELYFWVRYRNMPVDPSNDRIISLVVGNSNTNMEIIRKFVAKETHPTFKSSDTQDLKDHIENISGVPIAEEEVFSSGFTSSTESLFIGPQLTLMYESLQAGETILLTGPTGSGKTLCVLEYLRLHRSESSFVSIEGKEGMLDVDFLGAYLPQEDNTRKWKDGPLLYAMRAANLLGDVLLFIDELNRFQSEQQNIFIGLLNKKTGQVLKQMGLSEIENLDAEYYYIQVPMTSENVYCPCTNLSIVAACNLGAGYVVHRFDPALRRRFDTVIDFDYLPLDKEKGMLCNLGLTPKQAEVLAKMAARTREMTVNGELPGCINTAQLFNWGRKIKRQSIGNDLPAIMEQAKFCWADQVCGRDMSGKVNQGAFEGLIDQIKALKII